MPILCGLFVRSQNFNDLFMRGTLVSTLCLALLIGEYAEKKQLGWKVMGPFLAIVLLFQSPSVVYEAVKKSSYHSSSYSVTFFEWVRTVTDRKSVILPIGTNKKCAYITYFTDALCFEKRINMHTKNQYVAHPPATDVTLSDFQKMTLPGMTRYVLSDRPIHDQGVQFVGAFEGEYVYIVP